MISWLTIALCQPYKIQITNVIELSFLIYSKLDLNSQRHQASPFFAQSCPFKCEAPARLTKHSSIPYQLILEF